MGVTEHGGAILSDFNPILGHFRPILSHFEDFVSGSLRRRQNGGQGAAKAYGAVKNGVKMARWAPKKNTTEKLTVPPARSSICASKGSARDPSIPAAAWWPSGVTFWSAFFFPKSILTRGVPCA